MENNMRDILKSLGVLCYFLLCQVISTFGIMIVKIQIDPSWIYAVNDSLLESGMISTEYFSLIFEILYPSLIAADIIIMIPMIISAVRKKEKIFKKITINETLFLISLAIVLNFIVSFIVVNLPAQTTSSYDDLMGIVLSNKNFFMVMLTSGILAPIIEEFIFRYAMIGIFSKRGRNFAIFMSALMFGIAHFNIIQSSYAFVLGLVLGYLYWNERNILKSIIVHLVINSTSVMYEYAPDYLKTVMLVITAVCFIFTAIELYKKRKIKLTQSNE